MVAGISLPVCWFWRDKAFPEAARRQEPHFRSVAEKLNTIIIPEYPASDLTLEEVVEFLRIKSRARENPATVSSDRGVNIVIITGGERKLPARSGLLLKDVPLGEALRHVTGLVNLKFTIEQHAVAIREPQDMRPSNVQKGSALQQQLGKMIRPTIQFQDATLEEAVEYLRISQGCLDTGDEPLNYAPLNFVLHLREGIKRPPVSLDLRDIPISEALRYCAEISNARLRYDTAAVMITDLEWDASVPSPPPVRRFCRRWSSKMPLLRMPSTSSASSRVSSTLTIVKPPSR